MKRKKLYALLFASLFILSTVAMFTQPVAGATFTFAVPDEAKGMTLYTEVKVYDKDSWGDHKGFHMDDTANAYFGKGKTGANDVGAQSKYKVLDWESTDVWYFGDHVMEALLSPSSVEKLAGYGVTASIRWDYFLYLNDASQGLGGVGQLLSLFSDPYIPNDAYNATRLAWILYNASAIAAGTLDLMGITVSFPKTYKGTELERDLWFFTKDFESDPDQEPHIVPYIADPHNVYDSFLYFTGFMGFIRDKLINMLPYLDLWFAATQQLKLYPDSYSVLNDTAALLLTSDYLDRSDLISFPLFGNDNVVAVYQVIKGNIEGLRDAVIASIPDKKNYLTGVLRAGLPVYAPVDKYWEKVLDDFNINDESLWYDSLLVPHKGGIKLEGKTVVVEMEWENVWDDHEGTLEERESYEERYTYGDTGGQSVVSFVDGSDEFYRIESLSPAIPGYEISILLAAAAISALGLIYIVMKKRRK
ncbi:MAG: hypothetical protein ACFFAH_16805 [Promethearchaeota archaeon]